MMQMTSSTLSAAVLFASCRSQQSQGFTASGRQSGVTVATGEAEQRPKARTEQIRAWLEKDHLLLSKVHELLGREGLVVSYSSLYRFARMWRDFGSASAISVRRAESLP